jgi:hypothetical protein
MHLPNSLPSYCTIPLDLESRGRAPQACEAAPNNCKGLSVAEDSESTECKENCTEISHCTEGSEKGPEDEAVDLSKYIRDFWGCGANDHLDDISTLLGFLSTRDVPSYNGDEIIVLKKELELSGKESVRAISHQNSRGNTCALMVTSFYNSSLQ